MLLKDNKTIKNVFLNNLEVKKIYFNNKIVFKKDEVEKPNEIVLKNIIKNADFSNGTTGYTKFVNGVIQGIQNNCLTWVKQVISANTYILCTFKEELVPGRKYYGRCSFTENEEGTTLRGQLQLNAPNIVFNSDYVGANEFATPSGIFEVTEQYRLFLNITSATTDLATLFYLKEPMFIDVTDLYERLGIVTDEQMKKYMDTIEFFAEEKSVVF